LSTKKKSLYLKKRDTISPLKHKYFIKIATLFVLLEENEIEAPTGIPLTGKFWQQCAVQ